MPTERTLADLATAATAILDASYDLVYVDYRDQMTDEQVAAIVRGDMEKFWDLTSEWESDSRYQSAAQYADEAAQAVIDEWEREDDFEYGSTVGEEFVGSDERSQLIDRIQERDSGDWPKRLARNTPSVLLRIEALDEDHAYSFQEVEPERVLTDVGLPATDANRTTIANALLECAPEFSVLMGYWIVGADVQALYELPGDDDAEIEIVNPYLYLGNPFAGSGWITEKPLEGTVRVKRSELRTDKDAFGYAVDQVYGGLYASQFECELRPVVTTT